jgi:hypothetical protein
VIVYALGLTGDRHMIEAFTRLSAMTGGEFFPSGQGNQAIESLKGILAAEFGNLDVDRKVLAEHEANPDLMIDGLAERLEMSRPKVAAAISRLGSRVLLQWALTTS